MDYCNFVSAMQPTVILRLSATRVQLASALLFACCLSQPLLAVDGPAWWSSRGVIATGATGDDYALINQGQVKRLATQAYYEMEARLPGGAGGGIATVIVGWQNPPSPPASQPDDYVTINIGQLKKLAQLFYDRLAAVGYVDPPVVAGRTYLWTPSTADDDDYAYANIGQAKLLFSFDFAADTDGDGMPDWWERGHGLNPNSVMDAGTDPDGDGLTNLEEFQRGTRPDLVDSDGDQLGDGWEVRAGLDPLAANDPNADPDGDGQSNFAEFIADTSPLDPAPILGLISPGGAQLTP